MHMLRTVRNKTHDTEALVRACSTWATRGSNNTDMLFWKDVGNGILLDRPLPFKSHQSYRPLPCFIPALQEICSGLAKKKCGDDGDDLNTAVGISLPRWSGNAVIVTALIIIAFTLIYNQFNASVKVA